MVAILSQPQCVNAIIPEQTGLLGVDNIVRHIPLSTEILLKVIL